MYEPVFIYPTWVTCLANDSSHAIEMDGVVWPTATHAFEAAKFYDGGIRQAIQMARSPEIAREIAQQHVGAIRPDWGTIWPLILEQVLTAKLLQHGRIPKALLSTQERAILFNSPHDAILGCGEAWQGRNALGEAWMALRCMLVKTTVE